MGAEKQREKARVVKVTSSWILTDRYMYIVILSNVLDRAEGNDGYTCTRQQQQQLLNTLP